MTAHVLHCIGCTIIVEPTTETVELLLADVDASMATGDLIGRASVYAVVSAVVAKRSGLGIDAYRALWTTRVNAGVAACPAPDTAQAPVGMVPTLVGETEVAAVARLLPEDTSAAHDIAALLEAVGRILGRLPMVATGTCLSSLWYAVLSVVPLEAPAVQAPLGLGPVAEA